MNVIDLLLIGAIVLGLILAVGHMRKNKGGCCGDCSQCSSSCDSCKKKEE